MRYQILVEGRLMMAVRQIEDADHYIRQQVRAGKFVEFVDRHSKWVYSEINADTGVAEQLAAVAHETLHDTPNCGIGQSA